MARRTRIRKSSTPAGLSYGLTTMTVFMAGMVLVDSFNLNLFVDQPLAAKQQHDARTAFRATAVGNKGCHTCRASSRSNLVAGSSPSARRRTASGEAVAHQQQQSSRRCVTTTTTAAAAAATAAGRRPTAELGSSTSKLAARAQTKGTRSSSRSKGPSTFAGNVDSAPGRAGGEDGRYRRERHTEERVRLSAGLGHAPMSRAQAVSAFAAAGAAALVIGGGGIANAATEVCYLLV